MSTRIDLDPELGKRLRVHCSQVAGRNQRDVSTVAVSEYLTRTATPAERLHWQEPEEGKDLRKATLRAARAAKKAAIAADAPAFRLQDVIDRLGGVGSDIPEQTLRRQLGVILREAGFRDRRMRLPGVAPTQCWIWPSTPTTK